MPVVLQLAGIWVVHVVMKLERQGSMVVAIYLVWESGDCTC